MMNHVLYVNTSIILISVTFNYNSKPSFFLKKKNAPFVKNLITMNCNRLKSIYYLQNRFAKAKFSKQLIGFSSSFHNSIKKRNFHSSSIQYENQMNKNENLNTNNNQENNINNNNKNVGNQLNSVKKKKKVYLFKKKQIYNIFFIAFNLDKCFNNFGIGRCWCILL